MDDLCLPVDGEGDVLVGDEDELLHGNLFQFVNVSVVKKANCGQRGNSEITWLLVKTRILVTITAKIFLKTLFSIFFSSMFHA
jgi:hypothetical protein